MIISFDELSLIRAKNNPSTIVFTGGCFDLLHEGHICALKWRKSLGDILVVGVSSDERVRQRKGSSRPIQNELTRSHVIDAIKYVDYTFILPMPDEVSPTLNVIKRLKPDIFVDTAENRGKWDKNALTTMKKLGVEFVFDDQKRLNSTSVIIKRNDL